MYMVTCEVTEILTQRSIKEADHRDLTSPTRNHRHTHRPRTNAHGGRG